MSWDKRDGVHGGAHKNSWKELPFCRNDWWPDCNCSKNECKFYSKCFSFVKKHFDYSLVSNNINTLVIGYNKGWKQEVNIGKRNNQKFVQIPFMMLRDMLYYKCKLVGINVIVTEESYTFKCSFIDNEEVKKKETYLGKRTKRGLYCSKEGKLINADINGSYNIMRKGLIKASLDGKIIYPECRGFVYSPDKFNM